MHALLLRAIEIVAFWMIGNESELEEKEKEKREKYGSGLVLVQKETKKSKANIKAWARYLLLLHTTMVHAS